MISKYRLFKESTKERFLNQLRMPGLARITFALLQLSLAAHLLGILYSDQEVPLTYAIFLSTLVAYLGLSYPALKRLKKVSRTSGIKRDADAFWPIQNLVLLWIGSRPGKKHRVESPAHYYLIRFSDFLLGICLLAGIPAFGKFLFYNLPVLQYIYYRFFEV